MKLLQAGVQMTNNKDHQDCEMLEAIAQSAKSVDKIAISRGYLGRAKENFPSIMMWILILPYLLMKI